MSTGLLTLLQRAVLDRLPVRAPQELVHVVVDRGEDGINYNLSYPLLAQLREGAGGPLPAVVGHVALQLAFSTGGPPERVDAEAVTPDAFAVLGVPLAFGRDLRGAAGEHAVVLGEELWRRRFDGDRGVLGREVRLNGRAFTVVGVAPRAFRGLARGGEAALWVALPAYATLFPAAAGDLEDARMSWLNVFARTAPGSEQAFAARLGASTKSFQAAGALAASERLITLPGERGLTHMVEPLSRPLLLLNLLAALLLLLVAANFAGLLATRAVARRRELAVRASLGAARARLLRLLVVEALALTAAGALLAVPVALAALRFFGALPGAFGETVRRPTRPDARLLAIDVGLALFAGLAVALLPAWRASRRSLAPALRGLDGNNGAPRLRSALVVAQVALALTLLAGAGLFARTLQQLGRIGLGYEPRDVVVARVDLSAAGYAPQQRTPFWNELLRRVEALPGVRAAALASTVAPSPAGMSFGGLRVEGYRLGADESIDADVNVVSAGWFAALRVPLVAGRGLDGRDGAEALRAVVINESFARRYFAGRNPIGGRVFLGPPDEPGVEVVTIVGVAALLAPACASATSGCSTCRSCSGRRGAWRSSCARPKIRRGSCRSCGARWRRSTRRCRSSACRASPSTSRRRARSSGSSPPSAAPSASSRCWSPRRGSTACSPGSCCSSGATWQCGWRSAPARRKSVASCSAAACGSPCWVPRSACSAAWRSAAPRRASSSRCSRAIPQR